MKRLGTLVAAAVSTAASAEPPASDDQQSRLEALEQRIAQLESPPDGLTVARADAIRELVGDVLADAETRTSLQDQDFKSGYDDGFVIKSREDGLRLRVNVHMQVRYTFNHQDNSDEDDWRDGFENRRTKLIFTGRLRDPSWRFKVQLAARRRDGAGVVESAWIRKKFNDEWSMRAGQFKLPLLRERLVSSRNQLVIDRSLVSGTFNQGFSQGVELTYENDTWRAKGAYSDGLRERDTAWSDRTTEIAVTGRVEMLLDGEWDAFKDFMSLPGEDGGLMIGAAVHYQRDEYGTDAVEDEVLRWTVDASLELGGTTAFVALVGDHRDPGDDPTDDLWGVVAQVGHFISEDLELYGRYEWGDGGNDDEDLSVATVGFTKYISGRNIKFSTDVGYGFDRVDGLWDRDSLGWRRDTAGEDGQVVVRSQLQLLF